MWCRAGGGEARGRKPRGISTPPADPSKGRKNDTDRPARPCEASRMGARSPPPAVNVRPTAGIIFRATGDRRAEFLAGRRRGRLAASGTGPVPARDPSRKRRKRDAGDMRCPELRHRGLDKAARGRGVAVRRPGFASGDGPGEDLDDARSVNVSGGGTRFRTRRRLARRALDG